MHINVHLPDGPNPETVARLADQIREAILPVYYKDSQIGTVSDVYAVGVKIQLTLSLMDTAVPSTPFTVHFQVMGTPQNAIAYAAILQDEDIDGKSS